MIVAAERLREARREPAPEPEEAVPEAGTLWRHPGTGRLWRCLGPMGGRLPGGVRRAGAAAVPVDEEGRDCGEPEWRCLRSWAASMRREGE